LDIHSGGGEPRRLVELELVVVSRRMDFLTATGAASRRATPDAPHYVSFHNTICI
jgi:hypothetical protein